MSWGFKLIFDQNALGFKLIFAIRKPRTTDLYCILFEALEPQLNGSGCYSLFANSKQARTTTFNAVTFSELERTS